MKKPAGMTPYYSLNQIAPRIVTAKTTLTINIKNMVGLGSACLASVQGFYNAALSLFNHVAALPCCPCNLNR